MKSPLGSELTCKFVQMSLTYLNIVLITLNLILFNLNKKKYVYETLFLAYQRLINSDNNYIIEIRPPTVLRIRPAISPHTHKNNNSKIMINHWNHLVRCRLSNDCEFILAIPWHIFPLLMPTNRKKMAIKYYPKMPKFKNAISPMNGRQTEASTAKVIIIFHA